MFPTTSTTVRRQCRAISARSVIAAIPVAMVCAYTTHPVVPTPRVATDAFVETASIVDSPTTVGIADSSLYGMSQADIDTTLNNLESIGVQNVRILVPWGLVEPGQGTYVWTYLDEVVQAAAARNMGVVADINASPAWAATTPATLPGNGTPNAADFANFASTVATRYGNDISAYEIWNEPNSEEFYDPIDAASYTALLKAAYPAIKAANPNATVIAGALGAGVTFGNLTLDPVTFVQQMLADGAAGYFDDLSFHPYQESLEFSQGGSIPNSPINQLTAIEQLLVGAGLASDKVWITEYGLPTSDVSQQTQATFISDLLNTWENVSYAGPVFIYTTRDTATGSTNPEDTYGIYQTDWTPKAAVAVIQQFIATATASSIANPFAALAQQLAAAYAQAVTVAISQTVATLGQQIATAVAQALANAFAALGKPAASVATPTVAAKAVVAASTALAATTPVVAKAKTTMSGGMAPTANAGTPVKTADTTTVQALRVLTPTSPITPTVPVSLAATASTEPGGIPTDTLGPKGAPGLRSTHPEPKSTALTRVTRIAHKTG